MSFSAQKVCHTFTTIHCITTRSLWQLLFTASLVVHIGQLGGKNEGEVIDVYCQMTEKKRDMKRDRPLLTHYYEGGARDRENLKTGM